MRLKIKKADFWESALLFLAQCTIFSNLKIFWYALEECSVRGFFRGRALKYFARFTFSNWFERKRNRFVTESLTWVLKKALLDVKKAFSHEKSRFSKKKSPPTGGDWFWSWVLGFNKRPAILPAFFAILTESKSGFFLSWYYIETSQGEKIAPIPYLSRVWRLFDM